MGTALYAEYVATDADHRTAWERAVQAASGPWSRSPIGRSSGVELVHHPLLPLDEARRLVGEGYPAEPIGGFRPRKGGPAGALAVHEATDTSVDEVTLRLDADEAALVATRPYPQVREWLRGRVPVPDGRRLVDVDLPPGAHLHGFRGAVRHDDATVATAATDGDRQTRYFFDDHKPVWDAGFPTQSAARKALAERLADGHGPDQVGIYAITRRADGRPLAVGTRTVKAASLTVAVRTVAVADRPVRTGWLLFGGAPD